MNIQIARPKKKAKDEERWLMLNLKDAFGLRYELFKKKYNKNKHNKRSEVRFSFVDHIYQLVHWRVGEMRRTI